MLSVYRVKEKNVYFPDDNVIIRLGPRGKYLGSMTLNCPKSRLQVAMAEDRRIEAPKLTGGVRYREGRRGVPLLAERRVPPVGSENAFWPILKTTELSF